MMQSNDKTVPIPGVLATLAAGFDVTAKQFWLTLIPVLLDSFFWLGPRLSFRLLVERMVAFLQQQAEATGAATALDFNTLLELAPRTNLFTSLSVPLLGVPALMVGTTPEKTPLTPSVLELDSVASWFGLFILFSLMGVFLTAVYYSLTANAIRTQESRWTASEFLQRTSRVWLQIIGMGIVLFIVGLMVYTPLLIVGAIVSLLSPGLASIVLLMGPLVIIWLVIYLSFSPHGLIWNGRNLWRAMVESMQLVRHHMMPAMTFLILILLIGQALDWALLMADNGSWLTWASIWSHAFVSTSLLAATFIFYRDRHAALFGEQLVSN
jgi:hypothetical protein